MLKPSPRPVLLLAHGGFVVRNLLLGTFAERVMLDRPLLAAVLDPKEPELLRRFAGRPVRFMEHVSEPGRDLSTFEKMRTLRTLAYYFQIGAKGTKGVELAERIYDGGHSVAGDAAGGLLKKLGFLLQRLGWLGAFESFYLRRTRDWPITLEWKRILEREWPSVVVSSMLTLAKKFHPSVDLPPLIAAQELGIPCGMLVQSWDNLSTKMGVLPVWLDRYWSWSPRMNGELGSLYPHLPPERFRIVGSPQFDFHRRPELKLSRSEHAAGVGLDPARPYVLIGTGTPKALPDEHLVVAELIRRLIGTRPDLQILLRLHPKDYSDRWVGLEAELSALGTAIRRTQTDRHLDEGAVVSPFDFYRQQVNDLYHSAAVVNCASTLTVDAALLDKPVICLTYDHGPDWQFPEGRARAFATGSHYAPLAATGGIAMADGPDAALAAVLAYLQDGGLHAEGRRLIVEMVTATPDGGAGEALAIEALALAVRAG